MDQLLRDLLARAGRFEEEAHEILGRHEGAVSRIVYLDKTYKQLQGLSIAQEDLLKQALRCAEEELYRAAHVMAWAAFMDFFEEKLMSDGLAQVRSLRPKWKTSNLDDLREYQSEFSLIDLTQALKLGSKNDTKALHGLLNRRNQCAHPGEFFPDLNNTLGYISEILQHIKRLQPKVLPPTA